MNGHQELLADVAALKAAVTPLRDSKGMHCFSLNLSENALNVIMAARMQRAFIPLNGVITQAQDLAMLAAQAQPPLQPSFFEWVLLYALTPPHITLSPTPDPLYATVDAQFSLSALSIDPISAGSGPIPGATWTFRVSSPVKIVLGASTSENGSKPTDIVDLNLFPDHVFDIIFRPAKLQHRASDDVGLCRRGREPAVRSHHAHAFVAAGSGHSRGVADHLQRLRGLRASPFATA